MNRTWVAPAIDRNRTRFLALPCALTPHDLDPRAPKHPWDERYPEDGPTHGLARCACCGAHVKRVAIAVTTDGAEVDLGLDCYASHYPTPGVSIKTRLSKSTKARKGWEASLRSGHDLAGSLDRIAACRVDPDMTEERLKGILRNKMTRWEGTMAAIERDRDLTDPDKVDLLRHCAVVLARAQSVLAGPLGA